LGEILSLLKSKKIIFFLLLIAQTILNANTYTCDMHKQIRLMREGENLNQKGKIEESISKFNEAGFYFDINNKIGSRCKHVFVVGFYDLAQDYYYADKTKWGKGMKYILEYY